VLGNLKEDFFKADQSIKTRVDICSPLGISCYVDSAKISSRTPRNCCLWLFKCDTHCNNWGTLMPSFRAVLI